MRGGTLAAVNIMGLAARTLHDLSFDWILRRERNGIGSYIRQWDLREDRDVRFFGFVVKSPH